MVLMIYQKVLGGDIIDNVSLWLLPIGSDIDLVSYLEQDYTDDGDLIKSQFEIDYNIDFYDHDFLEFSYIEPGGEVALLEFSYGDELIKTYSDILGIDGYEGVVLLYKHSGIISESESSPFEFKGTRNIYMGD